MIEGHDILAQAQSGTGKTGAFTIASLHLIDPSNPEPQILQLSPTRELADQTYQVASRLADWIEGVHILKVVGGRQRRQDYEGLRRGAQVRICRCFFLEFRLGFKQKQTAKKVHTSTGLQGFLSFKKDQFPKLTKNGRRTTFLLLRKTTLLRIVCFFTSEFPSTNWYREKLLSG